MKNGWKAMRAALAAVMLVAMAGRALANSDGLVLRAAGFFDAPASGDGGTCTVPAIDSGIPVSSDSRGLWNTFGIQTIEFPETQCGGWMELVNGMTAQGINIESVKIHLRIAGAGQFRQFVPTRNGFPTACKQVRNATIFAGAHLFPLGTPPGFGNTGSGAAHVAFVNLFPMVSAQVISCLRSQYASLPTDLYTSFPLIIQATAKGRTDAGSTVQSNTISFTLNLRHLCGNGRVDDGEFCDPNAPNTCSAGACDPQSHTCKSNTSIVCASDADCFGTCLPQGDPMECNCVY